MEQRFINDMLYPSYGKRLTAYTGDLCVILYIQSVLIYSTTLPSDSLASLLSRISADWSQLSSILQSTSPADRYDRNSRLISYLTAALQVEYPSMIAKMLNLKVYMQDCFNDNCAKCILRLRKDIEVDKKLRAVEVIGREGKAVLMAMKAEASESAETPVGPGGKGGGFERKKNRIDRLVKQFVYNLKLKTEVSRLKTLNESKQDISSPNSAKIKERVQKIQREGLNFSEEGLICVMPQKTLKAMKRVAGKM